MPRYDIVTSEWGGSANDTMVEIRLSKASKTLPNYGVVHRFKAADGRSMHAWSLASGQHGIEHQRGAAISAAAELIYQKRRKQ
jgi:hypothetical protein